MTGWFDHLAIVPILLPLLAGAVLMLVDDRHPATKLAINLSAGLLLLLAAALLLARTAGGEVIVYRLGNWPTPFAITIVADRLSALMVLLTATLALASLVFSSARWDRAGPHFHSLFQFLLMGLNGAFLTGDLFNLFVFFEVMLAASYGLVLHGSGATRVKAGLHYIAINLAASALFLIGVSLIYGVTGTLNMADLAVRIPLVPAANRGLLEAGAGVLGVAFLVKAGTWPLGFWLPTTYAAAAPPIAALFAILSKLGIYVILRLTLLFFGDGSGASAHLADAWLFYGGVATIAFGATGVLASQTLARTAGFCALVSSGTLLAMIGYENAGVTAGALYYLVNSTLALGCFFLLAELVERGRAAGADVLAVTLEAFGDEEPEPPEEVGIATPATLAFLGISFACCGMLLAGMPPLSGFIGKFAMLGAALNLNGLGGDAVITAGTWGLVALVIVSGLAVLIALLRAGINIFWVSIDGDVPRVLPAEMAPILLLLLLCLALTVLAGPALAFTEATAAALHAPMGYVSAVLGRALPGGLP